MEGSERRYKENGAQAHNELFIRSSQPWTPVSFPVVGARRVFALPNQTMTHSKGVLIPAAKMKIPVKATGRPGRRWPN